MTARERKKRPEMREINNLRKRVSRQWFVVRGLSRLNLNLNRSHNRFFKAQMREINNLREFLPGSLAGGLGHWTFDLGLHTEPQPVAVLPSGTRAKVIFLVGFTWTNLD